MDSQATPQLLDDAPVPVRIKLAALWTSVTLCYVYGDYFEFYVPGKLQSMLDGRMGPLGAVTQGVLVGTAIMMAIPSLMVFLSVTLPAKPSRVLNVVFGSVYALIMVLAIRGTWAFYRLFGIVEIVLTLLVVWHAWSWPRVHRAETLARAS